MESRPAGCLLSNHLKTFLALIAAEMEIKARMIYRFFKGKFEIKAVTDKPSVLLGNPGFCYLLPCELNAWFHPSSFNADIISR